MLSQQQLVGLASVIATTVVCFFLLLRSKNLFSRKRYRNGTPVQLLALLPGQDVVPVIVATPEQGPGSVSGWYCRPRDDGFFKVEVLKHWDDIDFRQHVRLSRCVECCTATHCCFGDCTSHLIRMHFRSMFAWLCEALDPCIGTRDTNYRPAIDTQRRVAIFCELLGHGSTYRQLQKGYGISKTAVAESIQLVGCRSSPEKVQGALANCWYRNRPVPLAQLRRAT